MIDDNAIIAAAREKLNAMPGNELKDLTEAEVQVHLPKGTQQHTFTVFFERANQGEHDQWSVRNIVRPDELQTPQSKDPGKLE